MGPPPRSLAAEANGCFMVRVRHGPNRIQGCGARDAPDSGLPSDQPSEAVVEWLRSTGARHVAIHFDLDVIDPAELRSLYFTRPNAAPGAFFGVPQGRMTIPQVVRLLNDVAEQAEVVGLGITEHLPWDAIAIK